MADVGFGTLTRRLQRAVLATADVLTNAQPLIFEERIPDVDGDDNDILSTFTGNIFAADLINDGQQAVTYEAGSLVEERNTALNMKMGSALEQGLLDNLDRLNSGNVLPDEEGLFGSRINTLSQNLVRGVRIRKNALKCAMVLGAFSYDRLGLKITNASWGEPSDTKVTVGTTWSTSASATPITDILTQKQYMQDTYGEIHDTITLARADLANIFKTAEYQNKYSGFFRFSFPANSIDTQTRNTNTRILADMIDMEIETHDTQFRVRNADKTITTTRVQPINKVILWSKADWGNAGTWDFINSIVTESLVASIPGMPGMPPGLGGRKRGPVSYFTPQDPRLNPPGVTAWAVQRGWVRKKRKTAVSVLSV